MKQENAKSKKKLIYYVTLAISAVLLIVATVLTVYFVAGGNNEVVERPPVITPPDDNPNDNQPSTTPPDDNPNQPTGGEGTKFVTPVAYTALSDYNAIYASATTGFIYRHKAVDFNAEEGAEVCSMADGTVLEISMNDKTGNYIKVDHGDGLITLYRFVEPADGLAVGKAVKKGEAIASVAAAYGSEAKDGTHLHLEIFLNGNPADPANYIEIINNEK